MTQKGNVIKIQKSIVIDLFSQLANLPEREKSSDDPVSLPEIFRTKDYMAEIQRALKKGYTFEDLAKIFTERCGVPVSTRQIKYHYTRGKNQGLKGQSGRKTESIDHQKKRVSSKDVPLKETDENTEKNVELLQGSSKVSPLVSDSCSEANIKPGTFLIDMVPKEI
jgi:hypothetical protein